MPASRETQATSDKPIKILVIDDDSLFHNLIKFAAEASGYICVSAYDMLEAMVAISEAEAHNNPFSVVTIDMKFEKQNNMPVGQFILQSIKSKYANIACIIISGETLSPHAVLDLRDEYGLDYCISKDRLDPKTLKRGIWKALERVRPLGSVERQREVLEEALTRYKEIYATYVNNLALVELKKAQKGIDVSVDIENQITEYKSKLEDVEWNVQELTEKIRRLGPE